MRVCAVRGGPVADRGDEFFGCVGLDVGARALDDHGSMPGEGGFQALALLASERDVGVTPNDQSRRVGEVGKAGLDLGEEGTAGKDSAGEYGGGPPLVCFEQLPA